MHERSTVTSKYFSMGGTPSPFQNGREGKDDAWRNEEKG
jgi:hypothetical protein